MTAEPAFFWQWAALTSVSWFLLNFFGESVLGVGGLALMAIGQWLLLRRRHVAAAGWWIVATVAGFGVGVALGGMTGGWIQDTLDGVVHPDFGIRSPLEPGRSLATAIVATVVAGASLGSIIAAAQWQVLRRHAAHEWSWLLTNIASWSVAVGACFCTGGAPTFARVAGMHVVAGAIVGVGSAMALVHCLPGDRHRNAHEPRRVATAA